MPENRSDAATTHECGKEYCGWGDYEASDHECPGFLNAYHDPQWKGLYGRAISLIEQDVDGKWWASTRSEYASRILFCPWCGVQL